MRENRTLDEGRALTPSRIMVVEDEGIVAADLQSRLERLGHVVAAVCSAGEDAVAKAGDLRPDLVLMDIMLKGSMLGTEAAERIRTRYGIPVIYLTAYSDPDTLNRAKVTEPYGYLIKPFDEVELSTAIAMALYKHKMDRRLREQKTWLTTILESINDAVITTDRYATVTYLNPAAEALTGWVVEDAKGRLLDDVFRIFDEETGKPAESAIVEPVQSRFRRAVLRSRLGHSVRIRQNASPMNDDDGNTIGYVITFQRREVLAGV